jgi:hypothetical protein
LRWAIVCSFMRHAVCVRLQLTGWHPRVTGRLRHNRRL